MADMDVQRQRRDAQFDESPFGGGMCPLLLDIALFPVRYAIDEAPSQAGEPAPHPLASPWQGPDYPELQTRGYTLRQLRDGWLYVWVEEEGEQRIDEYRVEGATFGGQPHLTYSTQARLALAYSPVQWTERIQHHMLADAQARRRMMRPVDLMAALAGTAQPGGAFPANVGPLTQLAEHVADITPNGAVDGFTSTAVSTSEREGDAGDEGDDGLYDIFSVKPEITQDSVLAQVALHDEAVFVALDDDLGIVNDLVMSLLGRELELEQFNDEYGHQLEMARIVQNLCLVDIDELIDDDVRHDPARYREVMAKTGEFLDLLGTMTAGPDHSLVAKEMQARRLREELQALGMANPPRLGDALYEAWHSREHPRLDVRLDEVIDCLAEHGPRHERLQAHIEHSLTDLIAWLERLPISAQGLCFDTCDAEQNRAMIEIAKLVTDALSPTETGRAWLNDTLRERDSLIGLALMNFDPVFAAAFDDIARNYLASGTADGEPADNGISASGVATRIKGTLAVLGLESVQNSRVYQALAPAVQEAFDVLRQNVTGAARGTWEALAYHALPALSAGGQVTLEATGKALAQNLVITLVHPEIEDVVLTRDPEFEDKHRRWRAQDQDFARRIRELRAESRRSGYAPHERRAQFVELASLDQQRQAHALREPKRIAAASVSSSSGTPGNQRRANNLASVGYYALREQHRLKIEGGSRIAQRALKGWVERTGGGLGLLIAGLNVVNLIDAVATAQRDGVDEVELRDLGISVGYAAGSVMSLWVMSFWNTHANQTAMLSGQLTKVTGAGVTEWLGNDNQTKRLAGKLATRAAGLSVIGVITAALETWQIYQDYGEATSHIERLALGTKMGTTISMGVVAGAQLLGAIAGKWFAFGWIMASWATIALFGIGVVYMLASHFAARYNREGVRGWLYTSTWGKNGPRWPATDEGRKEEWRALAEIMLQPVARLTPVSETAFDNASLSYYGVGRVSRHRGFWLKLAFPSALAGDTVKVSGIANGGFWAPADSFEEGLFQPSDRQDTLPSAAEYDAADIRVWQAWIPASELGENAPFLMAVDYRETLLSSPEGRAAYTFYKPRAAQGKKVIEPNSEESRGLSIPARFALPVPATPDEQG